MTTTVYLVVIEHTKPLPESMPDSLAARAYGIATNAGEPVRVSVQDASKLEADAL